MPRYRTETQPQIVIEDPEMKAIAEQVLAEVKLEMVKGIAHTIDAQKYPLGSVDDNSVEKTTIAFMQQRKSEKQAIAKDSVKRMLRKPQTVRETIFGQLAQINLTSDIAVAKQAETLGLHDSVRLKKDVFHRLELINNTIARRPVNLMVSDLVTSPMVAEALVYPHLPWFILDQIGAKYSALGGETGFLKKPLGSRGSCPDGKGRYQHYEGGSIYWHPDTGAHEIHGAIRERYKSLGWEKSFLGYPITDERTTPDGIGRYNHFQGGSIYWTPATGAHEVHGAIRSKWAAMGWEKSYLGYPLTDERTTPDTVGRYSHFQGGSIYWTPQTGAHSVHIKIRDKWQAKGWELGYLGYPINDTNIFSGGNQMNCRFQGGEINWSHAGGASDSMPFKKLRFRIHKVKCIDETNPEWPGDDEIDLGGVATTINNGNTLKINAFRVRSDFDDGEQKVYNPPKSFYSYDLKTIPGWPKQLAMTMTLAEIGSGGFNDFLKKLLEKIREKVVKLIAEKTASLVGAALGSLIGALGGVVGSIIGAVVGWLVGKLFDWLISLFNDNVFPPWTAELALPSVWHRWGAYTDSPDSWFKTWAHGGKYQVWFDWQLTN